MKNIIKLAIFLAFFSPYFAFASVSHGTKVCKPIVIKDPKLQAQIDVLLARISILTKENNDLKQLNKTPTPVVKPIINVSVRDRIMKDGNPRVYSYPITLTNTSDTSVTINQVNFQVVSQYEVQTSIGSMYQTSNNLVASTDGTTNFLLFQSITVPAHQTSTTYVNLWGQGTQVSFYFGLKGFVSNDLAQFNF